MTRLASPFRRGVPLVAAVGILSLIGCSDRSGSPSSAGKSPNRMSASELAAHAATAGPMHAVNAVVPAPRSSSRPQTVAFHMGSSKVAVVSPPAPSTPEPPRMVAATPAPAAAPSQRAAIVRGSDSRANAEKAAQVRGLVGIQLKVLGPAADSKAAAEENALRKAREVLRLELDKLNPPVTITPSLMRIRTAYLPSKVPDFKEVTPGDDLKALGGQWYEAELNVALTDDQIRELRQEERVQNGLFGVGGLALGSLVLFGLLRAGTAAGRLSSGRLRPTKCVTSQILFWTIGPPLLLFLLARYR